MSSYRSRNSEFGKFLKTFFRIGRYICLVAVPFGVGLVLFDKLTPTAEEIRLQYEKDPISKLMYKDSMKKQNEMRRIAFEQAGIIDPKDPSVKE